MTNLTDPHTESFTDRITQAVENIVRPLHHVLENELSSLVDELASAIAGERTAALEQAREAAAAEKVTAVRDAVAAVKAEHDVSLADLTQAMAADREAAVRDSLAAVMAEHETTLTDLKQVMAADREAAVKDAQEASEAASAIAIAAAVAQAVSEAESRGATELAAAKLTADRESNERIAEAEARTSGALTEALAESVVTERQFYLATVARLLETVRAIDGARSMSEILDALAGQAIIDSGRVAVFLVRDEKLRGWRLRGFADLAGEPREVELRLDEAGVIARAVQGHDCAASSDRGLLSGEIPPLPPGSFLRLPEGRAGFAAPVCVAGQVVAVVYADEGDAAVRPVPNSWPELVEVVARHASRCLELLMAARIAAWTRAVPVEPARDLAAEEAAAQVRAGDDEDAARRYARLLISEIKLYHESDVTQGKRERDLLQRLRPEIDRARRLFEERVPPDVRARTDCFEQELVRTLADGNTSLLGQGT
jgi:hypothetical protein